MNKQELIERIEGLNKLYGEKYYVDVDAVLNLVKQLDEPQKVIIPQFVADYIEFKKENNFHVYGAMRVIEDHYDKRVPEWFYDENIETFARAWLDGYEAKEEKRYRVKLRSNTEEIDYLVDTKSNGFRFYSNIYTQRREHTRKELEDAGLGWVFDCPGVEVEEVEE